MSPAMTRLSLLRKALFNQYNVILVAGAALFSLAVSSTLPLLVGLGGELAWLALAAPSPSFRRWVAADLRRREEERWTAAARDAAAAAGLDAGGRARVRALVPAVADIAEGGADPRLTAALYAHARLAGAHQRLARLLEDARGVRLEEEIARLGQALADESDSMTRMSIRQALALRQRRMKQIEQVERARRALDGKLSMLEEALDRLRLLLGTGASPHDVAASFDDMLAAARFNPGVEAEAAALVRGRVTSTTTTQSIDVAALLGPGAR